MGKKLLDVIFASEKRKNVLLMLQDGPKEMKTIFKSLETTRPSLLPQMKLLEEHYLIEHYDDTYELTTIGKLVVDEIIPLQDTIEVLAIDIDYWGTRNLDFIPSHLLDEIEELKNCEIISPPLTELYSFHKSFNPDYSVSSTVYIVTTFLYPDFHAIFSEMLENGLSIHFVASQELFDKITKENREAFADFIRSKSFNLYVYNKKMNFLFFTFDDTHLVLSMLKSNREFDHRFVVCKTESAVHWAKGLFEYYLEDSTKITEI